MDLHLLLDADVRPAFALQLLKEHLVFPRRLRVLLRGGHCLRERAVRVVGLLGGRPAEDQLGVAGSQLDRAGLVVQEVLAVAFLALNGLGMVFESPGLIPSSPFLPLVFHLSFGLLPDPFL